MRKRAMASLVALGLGAVASNMAKGRKNMMSAKPMKKMRKRMRNLF
jgi:hypothetical protein